MPEQPRSVDGLTPPSAVPASVPASAPAAAVLVSAWKRRLLLLGGVGYLFYVLWNAGLLLLLPSTQQGLQSLVSVGVMTLLLGIVAFVGVGAIAFLRLNQPGIPTPERTTALIRGAAIAVPGILLSIATLFLITREPALTIDITKPTQAADFVAPLSVTFSVEHAAALLKDLKLTPVSYRWDIDGDGKVDEETVVPVLTRVYDKDGIYSVNVRIVLSDGNSRLASKRLIIQQSVFTVFPFPPVVEQPVVFSVSNLVKDKSQISEIQWDLDGDGKADETTKEPEVTFTYFKTGPVTVTATIELQDKTKTQYQRTVEIGQPQPLPFPVKLVTEPRRLVSPPPFGVMFTIDTKEPLAQVQWSFGEGEKVEGTKVVHTYDHRGNFPVTVKVRAQSGALAELSTVVRVVETLQLNDLTFDGAPQPQGNTITGEVPLTVNLKPRTNTPFVQFFWEAPEATEVGSTEGTLNAIYRQEGTYTLWLMGQDQEDHVLRQPITVQVKPAQSNLVIKMDPESGVAPLHVRFDASESFIPDDTITGFEWSFGDNTQEVFGAARVEHVFDRPGTYSINLTVRTTSNKEFRTSATITVRASLFSACILASRTSGKAPLGVQFSSTCSTGAIAKMLWDFGDSAQSDQAEPIHVFDKPGEYDVKLTIQDKDGKASSQTVHLSVTP